MTRYSLALHGVVNNRKSVIRTIQTSSCCE
jgi:hypothetical protein